MGRWFWTTLAGLVALIGLAFSLLNFQQVTLSVGFGTLTLPLGVLVLLALLTGALVAGTLLWAGVILPMRFRLRSLDRTRSAGNVGA